MAKNIIRNDSSINKVKERFMLNSWKKSGEKAITLIALVITVIILLILAGTAISIGLNEGELFGHTNNSVERYNEKVAEMENSLTNAMGMLDKVANPDLARYKLEVKVNYDEEGNETTVESPYYVWYPSKKYIEESEDEDCKGIKCRVLYNDDTYGLQIVSVDSVTVLALGHEDENIHVEGEIGSVERAQNSYNRAIMTLNEKAEEYLATSNESILSTDARCVGSNPLNKNYPDNLTGDERQAQMFITNTAFMSEYNGKYFNFDSNYEADFNRLKAIGAAKLETSDNNEFGKFYHLASRHIISNSSSYAFYIRAAKRGKFI